MNESKELLKDCFFKQFYENKISEKKYIELREYINMIPESSAKRILTEQGDLTYVRKSVHSAVRMGDAAFTGLLALLGFNTLAGIGSLIGFISYRVIRALFDKCTKHCGVFNVNTLRRQVCYSKCKLDTYKKVLTGQKALASKCRNSKNPQKCDKVMSNKIESTIKKLQKQEIKWEEIQSYAMRKGVSVKSNTVDIDDPEIKLYKRYER